MLRQRVDEVWHARLSSRYQILEARLPAVVADARQAVVELDGDQRVMASALLAETFQCAAAVTAKMGLADVAWLAADRAVAAAEQSGDPVMIAASIRMLARSLEELGRPDKAEAVATAAAHMLEPDLGTASPAHLSVFGALLLTAAVAAATQGDRVTASTLLAEATIAARRLGGDRNELWTVFGPTNVQIHRTAVLVSLHEGGRAVEEARTVNVSGLPSRERRAQHLVHAQAHLQCDNDTQALDALITAERTAPAEIHQQPAAHDLISELLRRGPPSIAKPTRALAGRAGVPL